MDLRTNEKKIVLDGSAYIKAFSINNHSEVSNELIFSMFNQNSEGNSLTLRYENIPNFRLSITDGKVTIIGKDDKALVTGLYYLNSIINSQEMVSNQIVTDNPKFMHREFALDVARNYFEVDEIKKIIDELAPNRINYLHLHLSDDQNFAIKSDTYPLLNSKRQYTKSEIREIVKYAGERGIEVIPEIDMPGHFTHILNAYPTLRCEGKTKTNVMCMKKENMPFIYNLIDEVMELFPGNYFHFGCDELDLRSNVKCSECYGNDKKIIESFINEVGEYILLKGKTPIVWNDALQYGNLNKEIVVQKWITYRKDNKSFAEYTNGRKFIIGSTIDTYFDYPYSLIPLEKTYEYVPSIQNVEVNDILGVSSHVWCEHISDNENLEKHIFPRIQAFGENAWVRNLDYNDFKRRVKLEILRLKLKGLNSSTIEEIENINYKEIINYFLSKMNMPLYGKPDYLEILYLTLDLLKNTQNGNTLIRKKSINKN